MYADNQPKRIIKLLLSSYRFSGLPEYPGRVKNCPRAHHEPTPLLSIGLSSPPIHLDQVGWSALIKRHLKGILYPLSFNVIVEVSALTSYHVRVETSFVGREETVM